STGCCTATGSISSSGTGTGITGRRSTSPTLRYSVARAESRCSACCKEDQRKRRDNPRMDIVLANPRGFCAGVDRAIEIVNRALETLGAPIYVRHEVVHNRYVVDDLKQRGAIFVEELDEVPDGATVIFSAHGVSQAVRNEATNRGLKVFDATCPLVTKVHLEVARQCRAGRDMVLVGHAGHPEVEGTMGQWRSEEGSGRIYLVENLDDVARLVVDQPGNLAY